MTTFCDSRTNNTTVCCVYIRTIKLHYGKCWTQCLYQGLKFCVSHVCFFNLDLYFLSFPSLPTSSHTKGLYTAGAWQITRRCKILACKYFVSELFIKAALQICDSCGTCSVKGLNRFMPTHSSQKKKKMTVRSPSGDACRQVEDRLLGSY